MIRLGRFLLLLVLASLLAGVVAAWLVPVDGGRFRAAIEAVAGQRLGATVRIDGPIVLRLLPTPTLQAATLHLTLRGGGGEAESLRLKVALGPLLAGRLVPRDLVLRRPRVRLPWPPPWPEWLRTPAFSARVQDGALTLGPLTLAAIDADLAIDPQTGTATLTGSLQLSGRPWRASASLSRRGGDGSAGLRMTLDGGQTGRPGPSAGFAAGFSGQLAADGVLSGRASVHGDDLSQLLPAPAVTFAAESRVTVAGGLVAAADVSAEIAGAPAHGSVRLQLSRPRLDVTLAMARLDLDQWLTPFRRNNNISLLSGVPLEVAVAVDVATLSGAALHTLRATLASDGSGATLREATAVLPGEAPLRLAGRIAHDAAGHMQFDGGGHLATADLAQIGGWLTRAGALPPGAFPAAAPRSLDIAAAVTLDGDRLRLTQVHGEADGARISGGVELQRASDGRPAVAAALQLDHLDLDRWLPRSWPQDLPPLDLDLQLDAAAATLRGVALGELHAAGGVLRGEATLRRLDAVAAGGTLAASGSLSQSGRLSDVLVALDLPRAAALDASLPWPLPAGLREMPATLRVAASGRPEELSAQLDATVGGLEATAWQRIDLSGGSLIDAAWRGPIRLRASSARGWLDAAGLGDLAWLGDGNLAVTANLAGGPAQVTLEELRAELGGLRGGGALRLDLDGVEPALSGRIVAEQLRLPGLPRRRDEPLAFGGLSGWRGNLHVEAAGITQPDLPALGQVFADLTLQAGSLRLAGLRAQVAGGALTGTAELTTATQPPRLTVRLALQAAALDGALTGLPVDLVAGGLDGAAALEASGHSVAALLATARGSLRLAVRDGVLRGIAAAELPPLLSDAAVVAALAGGETPALQGEITLQAGNGALTVANVKLTTPGAALGVSGSVEFAAATANLLWSIRPDLPDHPELDLRLAGRLPQLERLPELANLARWRVNRLPR